MPTLSGIIGTFKTVAEINAAYPPANWSGRKALIEGPPSYEVFCDGTSWTPYLTNSQAAAVANGTNSLAMWRARQRFAAKYGAGVSRLMVVGDSYAAGAGSTTFATDSYYAKLAARYAGKLVPACYGRSGYPIHGYTGGALFAGTGDTPASKVQVAAGDITVGIFGLNDLRGAGVDGATGGAGPNPDNWNELRSRVIAMATHFLIPEAAKVRMTNAAQTAVNPALTFGGSWTFGYSGNNAQVYTAANGATVSGTTAAGDLLIIRMDANSAADAAITFSVTVDGASVGTFPSRAKYDANWEQTCLVIPLPTNAAHSFVITKTGGDVMMFESVDCVDTATDFSATLVYAPPLYLNDGSAVGWNVAPQANSATAASATGGAAWNYGNGAAERFALAIDDAMNSLAGLGFNVVRAYPQRGWNTATMLATDTIHPNDRGHLHIAQSFAQALDYIVP